tara:strand:+ start:7590 stop:8303 length:714 start_codon:yes stop_codon:yes gene_type:complete
VIDRVIETLDHRLRFAKLNSRTQAQYALVTHFILATLLATSVLAWVILERRSITQANQAKQLQLQQMAESIQSLRDAQTALRVLEHEVLAFPGFANGSSEAAFDKKTGAASDVAEGLAAKAGTEFGPVIEAAPETPRGSSTHIATLQHLANTAGLSILELAQLSGREVAADSPYGRFQLVTLRGSYSSIHRFLTLLAGGDLPLLAASIVLEKGVLPGMLRARIEIRPVLARPRLSTH